MTTGKSIALTNWTFVGKVIYLSRLITAFLLRSKHLSNSCLQSPSTVVWQPKTVTVSIFFPSIFHEVMGLGAMILVFWMLSFKPVFFSLLFHFGQEALHFLPLEWCDLHIWGCWYFSQQSWFQLVTHPVQHFSWGTLHRSKISRVTIYSLVILLPNFEPIYCSMPSSNCCFLTCIQISQEAGQVVWYSHLFKNFPHFVVIHTVRGFSVVNEAEIGMLL